VLPLGQLADIAHDYFSTAATAKCIVLLLIALGIQNTWWGGRRVLYSRLRVICLVLLARFIAVGAWCHDEVPSTATCAIALCQTVGPLNRGYCCISPEGVWLQRPEKELDGEHTNGTDRQRKDRLFGGRSKLAITVDCGRFYWQSQRTANSRRRQSGQEARLELRDVGSGLPQRRARRRFNVDAASGRLINLVITGMANRAGDQQLLAIAVAVINEWSTCAEFWRASAAAWLDL